MYESTRGARRSQGESGGARRSPPWLPLAPPGCLGSSWLFLRKDHSGVSVLAAATAGGCNEELVLALLTHGVGDVNDTAGSPLRDAVKALAELCGAIALPLFSTGPSWSQDVVRRSQRLCVCCVVCCVCV